MCEMLTGGAETTALELVRALQGKGCEFTIATMRKGGSLAERFARTGARICEGVIKWRFDPLGPLRLARIIRRNRIPIVGLENMQKPSLIH